MILLGLLLGLIVVAVISAIIAFIPAALCLWIISGMGFLAWTFWQWYLVWFAIIFIYTLIFKSDVTVNKN